MRAAVAFVAALLLLTAAAADAGWQQARASGATARAYAIRVVVPAGNPPWSAVSRISSAVTLPR